MPYAYRGGTWVSRKGCMGAAGEAGSQEWMLHMNTQCAPLVRCNLTCEGSDAHSECSMDTSGELTGVTTADAMQQTNNHETWSTRVTHASRHARPIYVLDVRDMVSDSQTIFMHTEAYADNTKGRNHIKRPTVQHDFCRTARCVQLMVGTQRSVRFAGRRPIGCMVYASVCTTALFTITCMWCGRALEEGLCATRVICKLIRSLQKEHSSSEQAQSTECDSSRFL